MLGSLLKNQKICTSISQKFQTIILLIFLEDILMETGVITTSIKIKFM